MTVASLKSLQSSPKNDRPDYLLRTSENVIQFGKELGSS